MAYCTYCGSLLPEDARICPSCERPVTPPPAGPQPPPPPVAPPPQPPGPPPATGMQPPPYPGAVALAPTDGQAIAALVFGILGLVACPIVLSIVAIILGRTSQSRIQASGGAIGGLGLAKAGFILGIIGLVLPILFGLIFFAALVGSGGF